MLLCILYELSVYCVYVTGNGAIAFGGGAVLTDSNRADLKNIDPAQFVN